MATETYQYGGGPPVNSRYINHDYEGLQAVQNNGADGLQFTKSPLYAPTHEIAHTTGQTPAGQTSGYTTTHTTAPAPKKIFGMQRTVLALTISNILFAIALVVVAVELSRNTNKTYQDVPGSSGNSTVCPPFPTNTPTINPTNDSTTLSAPLPHVDSANVCFKTHTQLASSGAALNPGTTIPSCPLDTSKTEYTVPGTALKFRRDCNANYVGDDIANFPTRTMEDCIALCAQLNLFPASVFGLCKSVAWDYDVAIHGLQGDQKAFCWLKNSSLPRKFQEGIESAMLI